MRLAFSDLKEHEVRLTCNTVEKTQIKVADWGKAERVLRESNRFLGM